MSSRAMPILSSSRPELEMRPEGELVVTSRQRMLFWGTCDKDGPGVEITVSVRSFHHDGEVLLNAGARRRHI